MLDINNVFVIVAPDYTDDEVRKILKDDGYLHNFIFGNQFTKEQESLWKEIMLDCDEIWVYGKTYRTFGEAKWQHAFANKEGLEVYKMG